MTGFVSFNFVTHFKQTPAQELPSLFEMGGNGGEAFMPYRIASAEIKVTVPKERKE